VKIYVCLLYRASWSTQRFCCRVAQRRKWTKSVGVRTLVESVAVLLCQIPERLLRALAFHHLTLRRVPTPTVYRMTLVSAVNTFQALPRLRKTADNTECYTGCPRRNMRDFGGVFLMLNYTDITQNTYIQSWTVTE